MRGALAALLLGLTPLPAAAQVLWQDGPARLVLRADGTLAAERDAAPRAVAGRDGAAVRAATPLGAVEVPGGRLVLLSAVTDQGRRLLGFVLDPRGWTAVGAVALPAHGEVRLAPSLAAPDPAFPDPAPLVPLRLLAGRLVADAPALAATVPEALGPGRCPRGAEPASPLATVEDAARAARALPPSELEAAALRLAACLALAARPFEARRVLALALGREGAARVPALEAELAARLACSPHIAAIRRASPPEKTFLMARCG